MASACLTPRAPPTATTVFIYDAYTLRRTVVRALGHAAARPLAKVGFALSVALYLFAGRRASKPFPLFSQ